MKAQDIEHAIFQSYEQQYNAEPMRPHLGASMGADKCLRKLWYSFRWAKKVDHEGRILKLFQRGHKEEVFFVDDLKRTGINVIPTDPDGNQWRLTSQENKHVSGSGDGFAQVLTSAFHNLPENTWAVVEMKTHNDKSFKKLVKEGVRESKPLHYGQMQLYMKWSQVHKAIYIAVNKNDDDLHIEIVEFDSQAADQIEGNMIHAVTADAAPEKLHEDRSRFECKYCDYQDVCHGDKFSLEINCRTCVYSKPNNDGTWTCRKDDYVMHSTDPCLSHVFIPSLLESVMYPVSSDEKGITYKTYTGEDVRITPTGGDGFDSIEIKVMLEKGVSNLAESVKRLKEAFGAKVVANG